VNYKSTHPVAKLVAQRCSDKKYKVIWRYQYVASSIQTRIFWAGSKDADLWTTTTALVIKYFTVIYLYAKLLNFPYGQLNLTLLFCSRMKSTRTSWPSFCAAENFSTRSGARRGSPRPRRPGSSGSWSTSSTSCTDRVLFTVTWNLRWALQPNMKRVPQCEPWFWPKSELKALLS